MPALGRAVALAEPQGPAVRVGQDLHLDVAGPLEVALHVDLGPPEVGLRLALGGLHGLGHLVGARNHLHAPSAPAEGGLDGHGPPHRRRIRPPVGRGQGLGPARHARDAGRLGGRRELILSPMISMASGAGR